MDESDSILETTLQISGRPYEIKVFRRCNGKHYAVTRFGENDTIVSDGNSIEDTLRVHCSCLPLAVGCRWKELEPPE
jgi:hypothetical protein